ncbi:hypothetical protein PRNP1_012887 [Phytophthora ramorum]
MTEEQVDAAFFSSLSGFLAECDVALAPSSLTTHDFLAETETLLSSLEPPPPTQGTSEGGDNGQEYANSFAVDKRDVRKAQAATRRMRYRQKIKSQKEALRQEEAELSNEFSRLERQIEGKRNHVDRVSQSVWRAIATRQKQKRTEVEQTQRQLRAAVVGQTRMIHQMNALLQRSRVENEDKRLSDVTSGGGGSTVLFKNFISEMDAIYAQTDQVMEEAEFRVSSRLVYKPTRTRKQGAECFDSADKTVLPFRYEEACRAVSLVMMTNPEVLRCCNAKAQELDDTVTFTNNVKCQLEPGDISKLVVYAAVRRYKEAGRLVFAWRALSEGEGNLSGFHTHETGWLLLRPDIHSTSPSTVLESYVRFVPVSLDDATGNKADMDRFAKVAAQSGEEGVNEMSQMLEKMLLGNE